MAFFTRIAWLLFGVVAALGAFALYRSYARFHSMDAVLAAMRRFRLPARQLMEGMPPG